MNELFALLTIGSLDLATLEAQWRMGRLPALARLAARGELRPLVSPVPAGSPAAWASLLTGVLPQRHGLLLADEPWAGGTRPAGAASWRFAPVWARLAEAGVPTAGLALPAATPGAAWAGTQVDERLGIASGATRDDWPLPPDVAPPEMRDALRDARVHPSELHPALATPLLPADPTPGTVARIRAALARAATVQAALDLLLDVADWRALFVHLDWLEWVTGALEVGVDHLPEAAWTLLDQAVGAIVARLPSDASVTIASIGLTGPGFLLAIGCGRQPGARGAGVSTLAVAPSVFAQFGLVDRTLGATPSAQGRVELTPGEREVTAPSPRPGDLARLAAAGLVPPPIDPGWRHRRLVAEAELALAADPARAAALAREALGYGESVAALGVLASATVATGELAALPDIAGRIAALRPEHVWADLAWAAHHVLGGDIAAARPHLIRAAHNGTDGDRLRAASLWLMAGRRDEAARLFRTVLAIAPYYLGALLGLLSTETVRGTEAEALLRRVLTLDPEHREARSALASLLRSLGRKVEAAKLEQVVAGVGATS